MKTFIAVDVGGTNTKLGIVKDDKVIARSQFSSPKDYENLKTELVKNIFDLAKNNEVNLLDVVGVGIGFPGLIDEENGVVDNCPALSIVKAPVVKDLQEILKVKVKLCNDANLWTLGEYSYGSAKKYKNVVGVTLGTGIGGGIIINGKLYLGTMSCAGEIGHMQIQINGKPCKCGRKGCFQQYASANALIEQANEMLLKNNLPQLNPSTAVREIFKNVVDKNPLYIKVLDKYISYLAMGLVNVMNVLRPQAIIIGGGIAYFEDCFLEKLIKKCKKLNYGYVNAPSVEIMCSQLKNDAAFLGVTKLF